MIISLKHLIKLAEFLRLDLMNMFIVRWIDKSNR